MVGSDQGMLLIGVGLGAQLKWHSPMDEDESKFGSEWKTGDVIGIR